MGFKISWTGLVIYFGSLVFGLSAPFQIAGVILMIIGAVVMWVNKP